MTDEPLATALEGITDPERRADAARLDALFREVTGWAPEPWHKGATLGYGRYSYTYPTGRSGAFFATGFRPKGRKISIHILPGYEAYPEIAARLGPHEAGKSCWYIRRLAEIDEAALADLIRAGLKDLDEMWPIEPT